MTYVIHLAQPYTGSISAEIRKARKIQFIDAGLRNSIMGDFCPMEKRGDDERGKLRENFAWRGLADRFGMDRVKYWKSGGGEVDFVVDLPESPVPVEVKSRNRLKRGMRVFVKNYEPEFGIVFSDRRPGKFRLNRTEFLEVPLWLA